MVLIPVKGHFLFVLTPYPALQNPLPFKGSSRKNARLEKLPSVLHDQGGRTTALLITPDVCDQLGYPATCSPQGYGISYWNSGVILRFPHIPSLPHNLAVPCRHSRAPLFCFSMCGHRVWQVMKPGGVEWKTEMFVPGASKPDA